VPFSRAFATCGSRTEKRRLGFLGRLIQKRNDRGGASPSSHRITTRRAPNRDYFVRATHNANVKRIRAAAGSVLFLALAPGVVAGLVPWVLTHWRSAGAPTWLQALGWVTLAAGATVLLSAFGRFVVEGLGTPAPAAPTADTEAGGDFEGEATSEVLAGVSLTQHVGDLSRLAASPPERFRLFLGYAGWGAGQLIEEILRNDWLTAPARGDLIFAPDPDRVWSAALESVGVDPATLPSWTPSGNGEETAN